MTFEQPKKHSFLKILLYFISIIVVISFIVATTSAGFPPEKKTLDLPHLAINEIEKKQTKPANFDWTLHSVRIKKNSSLSQALDQIGITTATILKLQNTQNSKLLTNLHVGDYLRVWLDKNKQLQKIVYPKNKIQFVVLTKLDNKFTIKEKIKKVDLATTSTSGIIKGSLYLSGVKAGLSGKTIMNLSDIFSWEIDFIRQLRKGDPFKVVYERKYLNGEYIGDGRILAAEIITNGENKHTAFLLNDKQGKKIGYFNEKGKNLRKAFLKNPVDYVRITSKFNPKRFHPKLKKWKYHRGVDYGGPIGTPIRTTGDGKIIKRYRSTTYGNVIFIQHANQYMTVYAHLSKFGKYKKGHWVKQGQVIGYLGATGRVTGPHLHYEFRKNGVHKDPLKIKFPNAGAVPRKYKNNFTKYVKLMQSRLDSAPSATQLATDFE